jgi:hypothetical protein
LLCFIAADWRTFLEALLGPEGMPGSAPWPWKEELKPFMEMRYIAREWADLFEQAPGSHALAREVLISKRRLLP